MSEGFSRNIIVHCSLVIFYRKKGLGIKKNCEEETNYFYDVLIDKLISSVKRFLEICT